jgi:hypothetical protein
MTFTPRTAPSAPQLAFFDDTPPPPTQPPTGPVARANDATGWTATYSPCERFRYLLYRPLLAGTRALGRILWVMLNPSTATEWRNDPTIAKCMAYSTAWGYSDIEIANAFGLRSSDPDDLVAELKAGGNPIGVDNDRYIIEAGQRADVIVYACGVPPFGKRSPAELRDRPRIVYELLRRYKRAIHAMAITKNGNPSHPLYLTLSLTPIPFEGWPGDAKLWGYTLAAPFDDDGTIAEHYPYAPDAGTTLADPDTSTVVTDYARRWPTVPEALAFRATSKVFGESEVKVVRGNNFLVEALPPPSPLIGVGS